jgi:hypothetical protein
MDVMALLLLLTVASLMEDVRESARKHFALTDRAF